MDGDFFYHPLRSRMKFLRRLSLLLNRETRLAQLVTSRGQTVTERGGSPGLSLGHLGMNTGRLNATSLCVELNVFVQLVVCLLSVFNDLFSLQSSSLLKKWRRLTSTWSLFIMIELLYLIIVNVSFLCGAKYRLTHLKV